MYILMTTKYTNIYMQIFFNNSEAWFPCPKMNIENTKQNIFLRHQQNSHTAHEMQLKTKWRQSPLVTKTKEYLCIWWSYVQSYHAWVLTYLF